MELNLKRFHGISHIFVVHMWDWVHMNINCYVQNFAQMASSSLSKVFKKWKFQSFSVSSRLLAASQWVLIENLSCHSYPAVELFHCWQQQGHWTDQKSLWLLKLSIVASKCISKSLRLLYAEFGILFRFFKLIIMSIIEFLMTVRRWIFHEIHK